MPPKRSTRRTSKSRKTLLKRLSSKRRSPKKIDSKPLLKPTVFYFRFYVVTKNPVYVSDDPYVNANLTNVNLNPFIDVIRNLTHEFFTTSAPYTVVPKQFSFIKPNVIEMKATVQRNYDDGTGNEKDFRMWVSVWDEKSINQSSWFNVGGVEYQVYGVMLKK